MWKEIKIRKRRGREKKVVIGITVGFGTESLTSKKYLGDNRPAGRYL